MDDSLGTRGRFEVTVVSGLSATSKSTVARALTGGAKPTSALSPTGPTTSEEAVDLAELLVEMVQRASGGHVAVELPADADVMHVALVLEAIFEACGTDSAPLLRNIVAVVDVADVLRMLFQGAGEDEGDLDAPERLAAQLEFATTVVLSGVGAASVQDLTDIRSLIVRLNPWATVLSLEAAVQSPRRCVSNRRRPAKGLAENAGWMLELAGRTADLENSSINAVVFRDPRPFHPGRLATAIESGFAPEEAGLVLRSRGLVTLASRPETIGSWASAGEVLSLGPTAMSTWDVESPVGQEIAFFGCTLDHAHLTELLGRCLLTPDELIAGVAEWASYPDTFPEWELSHGH